MRPESKCEVLIAGAGPAGLATALYLLRKNPGLSGRIIALEKARHPRFKTCAGGLIPKTILALQELGLELGVPAVEVLRGTATTCAGEVDMYRGDPLCTVIRRDQFDARLAGAAKIAGLTIVEDCRVREVAQSAGSVRLETDRGTFEAPVLVGADGSGSRVRAAIFGQTKNTVGRALMTDVPVDRERTMEFVESRYRFDFRCVGAGTPGYAWSFPCLLDGKPHLNVGIYDQHPPHGEAASSSPLLERLRDAFPDLGLGGAGRERIRHRAFPIRWFNASDRFASGRVILAGDAAGVDPLMGEGISCAFEHGKIAAACLTAFLDGDHDALARYDTTLHRGATGKKLRKLAFAARHFYGPRYRPFFKLAQVSRTAQQIGVDWYNGAANMDEWSTRSLIAKWLKSILLNLPVR